MKRVAVAVALLVLLLGVAGPQRAAARFIAPGRWVHYAVTLGANGGWSTWYSTTPWPVRFRFKCSQGAVIVNAQNTSDVHQGVRIAAWDAESSDKTLSAMIDNGYAERNQSFSLPMEQSVTLPLDRPQICSASPQTFAFGVVYD
jgi:hypothetical protein